MKTVIQMAKKVLAFVEYVGE